MPYLFKKLAEAKTNHTLGRSLIRSTGVTWDVETGNSQATTSSCHANHILENNVGLLLVSAIANSLVADGINRSVNLLSIVSLDDHIHSITLGEINRRAADLLRGLESLGNTVDDKDSGGAAQNGRVGGHETDGTGAENSDTFARSET